MRNRASVLRIESALLGAVALSVSAGAMAQSSVTLYGIADAGVEFLTGAC